MSDNYVDPILAEDFDPDGPAPNVDYSKMKLIDVNAREEIKLQEAEMDPVLTVEEKALILPSPARLVYNKAILEGATEEVARAAAEEVGLARAAAEEVGLARSEEKKKLQDKE